MKWRNIKLIFLREARDQLRDRRTLFMVAVLPLLLYPALGIGMLQMTMLFTEQPRTVVVLGEHGLPADPPLIQGNHFVETWFDFPQDVDKLVVVGDSALDPVSDATSVSDQPDPETVEILSQARRIKAKLAERAELEARQAALMGTNAAQDKSGENYETAIVSQDLKHVNRELSELFAASRIQVLMIIPKDFGTNLERVNQQLAEGALSNAELDYARPIIVRNSADEKSVIAYRRVFQAMKSWESQLLKQRLDLADLPETLPVPVNPDPIDLAEESQLAANLWSKLFPALLVIMAVTGAFYPAVDLAAGEKERGTMETLLICPATRTELVVGKFLTVMVFSMSTALLNLGSMGLTGRYMVSVAGSGAFAKIGDVAFPTPMALFWLIVLLIPLAALFSALCLALATFARSTKEGQYYLTPLLMVTLGLTVFCLSPAVEIDPFRSLVPVMGIALLLKGLLLNSVSLLYAIPVLLTSFAYSGLALWWAIEQFNREEVLFREAERFELSLWVRHLLRDKEPMPSFSEAGFCFMLIMFLQFAAMKLMQDSLAGVDSAHMATPMMRLLLIQQLAIIASPALFMGVMLTTSVVRTFRLRIPSWRMVGLAIILPVMLHPVTLELQASLSWFFPQLPKSAQAALKLISDDSMPLWFVLLTFAVAPAICEETAFRGFILSGFSRSRRIWLAIVLSSVCFGVMHMIPQQVFNATLLGLVLGLIAIRSNSLLPGIVFHFIYNAMGVTHGRVDPAWAETAPLGFLIRAEGDSIRYQWPTLIVAVGVSYVLLRWLVQQTSPAQPVEVTDEETSSGGHLTHPNPA